MDDRRQGFFFPGPDAPDDRPGTTTPVPAALLTPAPPHHGRHRAVLVALVVAVLVLGGGVVLGKRMVGVAPAAANVAGDVARAGPPSGQSAPPTTPAMAVLAAPVPGASAAAAAVEAPGTLTYLADLDPTEGVWSDTGVAGVGGRTYAHALRGPCDTGRPETYEYGLSRRYSTFTALAGMTDLTDPAGVAQLEFFRDGVAVETVRVQRGATEAVTFPVVGARTLRIVVSTVVTPACPAPGAGPALADARLIS